MRAGVRIQATMLACMACAAAGVRAQTVLQPVGALVYERYTFSTPAAFDLWSLSLISAPFGAVEDVSSLVSLRLSCAWASGLLERSDGTTSKLDGLTDTELSARFSTRNGQAALTTTLLLPTGTNRLTGDELFVAGAIAADLLPFRVTNWGGGGGAGAAVAVARPFGDFVVGASVGYVVARSFEPLEADEFEYRPGNQLHVRAAIDRTIGGASKAAIQLVWQRFSADEGDGRNVFQSGDRFRVAGTFDFPIASADAGLYAGWMRRGDGEFVEPADVLPTQSLVYSGFTMRQPIGAAVLQPGVDVRILDIADGGRGYTAGIGASMEFGTRGTTFVPRAGFRFGRLDADDGIESAYKGFELGLVLRFGSGMR
jgi:hypothetical protein